MTDPPPLAIGQCATLACLMEVTAPKPGNVHRGADFEDATFWDFAASAVAIGPVLEEAAARRLGPNVLRAVKATRRFVETNTNLGTLLLVVPLAMVPRDVPLAEGVAGVLAGLDAADARDVYEAIRLARPGGLGRAGQFDVRDQPPGDLIAAMREAAGRDLVARQYVEGFSQVLEKAVPWIAERIAAGDPLNRAIVHVHVRLMGDEPDSLIARKCGAAAARESADRAAAVLAAGEPGEAAYHERLADLDFWLRGDGHRRNPGTTADLVAAGLFACLRDGIMRGRMKDEG